MAALRTMYSKESKLMKQWFIFIAKIIGVLGLTYGAYHALFWFLWVSPMGPDAYTDAYQHALLRQIQALEAPEREPEVIVFGSSYVPFSIDTKVMEPVLGQPVQTLGVEASIGIPFLVDVLYDTAKPGDTVVYMLGKSNWYNEDFMVISAALEADKDKLQQYWESRSPSTLENYKNKMLWRKLYALTGGHVTKWLQASLSNKPQVYDISSFDAAGNMTVRREGTLLNMEVTPEDTLCFEDMETQTLDMLNEFARWCKEEDITFVIAYATNIEGYLEESPEELAQYHAQMQAYMEADILLTPEAYFMPVEDFYNHIAHLNSEGAEKYSQILAEALVEYMHSKEDDH